MRLDGKIAYITGASAGIGAATALSLAKLGAGVVLGARRREKLDEVQARIEREVPKARVLALDLDVTNDLSLDEWIDEAASLGPCSILINNAGLALGRPRVDELDLQEMDAVLDVNVRSAFAVTRKLIPGMIARNSGDVVMLGSVAANEPYAGGSIYCASKAALHAFSRSLRAELLGKDIRVVVLEPGMVETEFSVVRNKGDVNAAKKVYAGMTPVTADDVAECIAFALTRPRHLCLDSMMIMATDQLGTQTIHRR
jgi:NADP-dependent 3-hydroxy acid dehydrogenase YdfG